MEKPYSPSCERNREPLLSVLQKVLPRKRHLLEIGSGTGQHAYYFAPYFPELKWQTSDVEENHSGIQLWLNKASTTNILSPLAFHIGRDPFPTSDFDTVFTANTLHIMSWEKVEQLIKMLGASLPQQATFIAYGPFNYGGSYTSKSNATFDQWLKERDPESGIRSFEAVCTGLKDQGISLVDDIEMPANNRTLVFVKDGDPTMENAR